MADGEADGQLYGSLADSFMTVAFTAVAFYNVVEITILILNTFRSYKGVYFWSMIAATWGIFPYSFGFFSKFLHIIHNDYINITFVTIGWWGMVTGQSLVLWSRLHIVVFWNPRLIKGILIMIIVNAICFHLPTTVMTFGSNSPKERYFLRAYSYMEKIQITVFFCQECIIAGVYLFYIRRLVYLDNTKKATRRILHHALVVNALVIALDIALLGTEFADLYQIQTTFKGMVYSIKLKAEFLILNRLRAHLLDPVNSHHTENGATNAAISFAHNPTGANMVPMKISVQKDTHVAVDRQTDDTAKYSLDHSSSDLVFNKLGHVESGQGDGRATQ